MIRALFKPRTHPFAPRRYGEIQRVSEQVYIFRNITNSSFVVGGRAVAVIDTQVNTSGAKRLLEAVRSVTDKPIAYVINTHYHWDHTSGNQLFKDQGATIISSALTKEFMVQRASRQKEFLSGRGFELGGDPLLPDQVFRGEMTLDVGNSPLRIFFAGEAESDDASAIHMLRDNVLASGDTIMTGSFPIFGQPVWDEGLQGDGRWQAAIRTLLAFKPKHIIPGHGPLAHAKDVDLLLKIEDYFCAQVRDEIRKNRTLPEILNDLEGRLPSWMTGIPLVWGTPRYAILRVYRGLTKKDSDLVPGWQQYKPSVIPEAPREKIQKVLSPTDQAMDFLRISHEAQEGGDTALQLSVLKNGVQKFPEALDLAAAYAEALVEASRVQDSVLEKGDFFQEARRLWEESLSKDPWHLPTLLGMGRYLTMMAYRNGDDPKEGMELLERIRSKNPGGRIQAEAEFYLGMGYRRLGDEDAAKRQFKTALRYDAAFRPALLAGGSR